MIYLTTRITFHLAWYYANIQCMHSYLAHSAMSEASCITTIIFAIDYLSTDETCIFESENVYLYLC